MKPRKLTPLPRTIIKPQKPKAAVIKQLDALVEELAAGSAPPIPTLDKLLATAAKTPYAPDDIDREVAEIRALKALITNKHVDAARKLWLHLVREWTKHAPVAGKGYWKVLARATPTLDAVIPKTPASLRGAIARAWALGTVHGSFTYQDGKVAAKPSTDGETAWRQACIAITRQDFDAARAATDAVLANKSYASNGRVLDVMLRREQGDRDGAIAAFREVFAAANKRARKEDWAHIGGLYVLIGMKEPAIVDQILEHWRTKMKGREDEREFFRVFVNA